MKNKIVLLGAISTFALATIGVGTLFDKNQYLGLNAEAASRTITFTWKDDVTSSAGSSFYLVGYDNSSIIYSYSGDTFGSVRNSHYFDIYTRNTESLAKFSKITKISLTYHIPGPEKNIGAFKLGDAETESYDDAVVFSFDGTNDKVETVNFYPSNSQGANKIIRFANTTYMYIYISSFSITYTC